MNKEKLVDYKKEFIVIFKQMAYRYSDWQVWNDFLIMTAVSFANVVKNVEWKQREEIYLNTVAKYQKEELKNFPHMLALLTQALEENPRQDFLGEVYAMLELNQHQKGQFFTPYDISEFMSEIQMADLRERAEQWKEKGYMTISDSACGAGVMLIAAANIAIKYGINYQENILFVAQDIDHTAAFMCFIQLSLLGCSAIVIIGDTLSKPGFHPDNELWMTPFYHLNAWRFYNNKNMDRNSEVEQENLILMGEKELAETSDGQYMFCLEDAS